jgi:ABC-type thiamin/hydroxymethylpyrimidine transport system permease subunit
MQRCVNSRRVATITILGALGGVSSVAIGWGSTFLSLTPLGPIAGQLLAGLHVFWLVLVAVLEEIPGAATAAGALKGLLEMMLPNHLGVFVFFMSILEGAIVDIVFLPLRRTRLAAVLVASGLSSISNLLVIEAFQLLPSSFSLAEYAAMYGAAFISGLMFGGYLSLKSLSALKQLSPN